jgi:hypothetical protein
MASTGSDVERARDRIERIEDWKIVALARIHAFGEIIAAALDEAKKLLVMIVVLLLTALGLWTLIAQKLGQ